MYIYTHAYMNTICIEIMYIHAYTHTYIDENEDKEIPVDHSEALRQLIEIMSSIHMHIHTYTHTYIDEDEDDEIPVDHSEALRQLMEMGFAENQSRRALAITRYDHPDSNL